MHDDQQHACLSLFVCFQPPLLGRVVACRPRLAATVTEPASGLVLEVLTTTPGVWGGGQGGALGLAAEADRAWQGLLGLACVGWGKVQQLHTA